jgi:RNA 3'-terminal phosphate cyclase (ATP)
VVGACLSISWTCFTLNFVEIDGSQGEGGGQILRTSVSLSCILNKPIWITNIRAGRKEPGLRPQHLTALASVAQICNGDLSGASIGSTEIRFEPGKSSSTISRELDIGTAGSVSLTAQTLIPIAAFRPLDIDLKIIGGTEVPFSPTVDYLQRVALPAYRKMGIDCSVEVLRRGYFPRGGGLIRLRVHGTDSRPHAIELGSKLDACNECTILSVSRALPCHVAERQIRAAKRILEGNQKNVKTETDCNGTARCAGSSILVYFVRDSRFVGTDALGERNKPAEQVGREAAYEFLEEIETNSSTDSHLADMLPTILCCVNGRSTFTTSRITQHLRTNLAIAKKLTNCDYSILESEERDAITIDGVAENSN